MSPSLKVSPASREHSNIQSNSLEARGDPDAGGPGGLPPARGGPGAASSLIVRMSTGQPSVALANRLVPVGRSTPAWPARSPAA